VIDANLFPEAAAYVSRLRDGLDSHPHCQVKGSVMREVATAFDAALTAQLPPTLRSIIESPPPVSTWIAEVPFNALVLVQSDHTIRRTGRKNAMHEFAFETSKALLSTPLYKILFLVVSPERLVSGVDKRWAALRRGTFIELVDHSREHARLRVHYPPHHYTETLLSIRAQSIRAALVCARAKDPSVNVESRENERSDFVCRWR
jgi:hypothetical protein